MRVMHRHTLLLAENAKDVEAIVRVARGLEKERLIRWLIRETCPHMPTKVLAAATNCKDSTYFRTMRKIIERVYDENRDYK